MKTKQLVLILLTIFFVMIMITTIIFYKTQVYETRIIYTDIEIINKNVIGFNIDTDALHFGKMIPGNTGTRTMIITNDYYPTTLVKINSFGETKKWLSINPNNFVLENGEKKEVHFTMNLEKQAPIGNFSGGVKVILLKK
ncbi:MAG: hypothetical protein ABIC91_07090 [Nanoarchaeota archaeon]|nr:hypothetical protein [Nanoarchaeota archaeon]MBU1849408.1 hypothetical protein [Nanoarchaeota archaeon]